MLKLPPQNRDLRWYVIRRDLLRVLSFLAWLGIWLYGAISYNQNHQTYPEYRRVTGWRMLLWMGMAIVTGFLLFRVWKFFTDRTFAGVVVSTGISRSSALSSDPGSQTDGDFCLNTRLKIRGRNGRCHRIQFEQKRGFYQYYDVGAELVHFHGLPYPVSTDPAAPNGYVCAVCGTWSQTPVSHCSECHHSMVDPAFFAGNSSASF